MRHNSQMVCGLSGITLPDAFNVTATHLMERANERSSISLGAAEASIALSLRMAPRHLNAYTGTGEFTIRLTVDGVDGVSAHKNFSVKVTGNLRAHSNLIDNRRFVEPTDR